MIAASLLLWVPTFAQDELSANTAAVKAADADFPYRKIVESDFDQLHNQKFKYDSKKNQFTLNHVNGWNATANAFKSVDVPSPKNYSILVQYGKNNQIAYVEVVLYDEKKYRDILDFAQNYVEENIRSSKADGKTRTAFEYGTYSMTVTDEYIEQEVTKKVKDKKTDEKIEKTEDRSYHKYTYVIKTGVAPSSQYLDKLASKKKKKSKSAEYLF